MSMPFAARLRRLSWYAAIHRSRNGPPRLMSSCTGTLSTTDQLRPDASTSSLRSAIASAVHGSPLGTSCRAVTTPVAPVCLMSARVISYTHLRAHETRHDLVCRLLLEKKKKKL